MYVYVYVALRLLACLCPQASGPSLLASLSLMLLGAA